MYPRQVSEGHPQRVGRYRLVAPLGVGGMATVYLALQEGPGGFERQVALKLLHPHLSTQANARADFLEEARLAASIRHPHVVAVLDVGEQPPHVFLVMEYIEGGSLAALCEVARPARPVALRILLDALAGLHAAHELGDGNGGAQGVVHRDFSPQNILVGVDGATRLTDFGIAKAKSRAGYTAPGLVKGKLRYMSPEQAQGKALDRRSDVWSAGAVAWELMSGARLFDDSDEVKTVLRLVSGDPPRLSTTEAGVPDAMSDAVAGALRRGLAARTASAAALAERIRAAFPDAGAIASPAEVAAWARAGAAALAIPPAAAVSGAEIARGASSSLGRGAHADSAPRDVTVTSSSADVRPAAIPARWRGRGVAAAAAAIAAVAVFAVPGFVMPRAPAGQEGGGRDAQGASDPAPAQTGQTGQTVKATAAPTTASAESAPSFLELRASAALAEVRIGRRVVAIAPAASHVTLQLLPEERGVALALEARAADGRRVTTQVDAGSASVALDLDAESGVQTGARASAPMPAATAGAAAAKPKPATRPPVATPARPAGAKPPPLPPSPYGPGAK